VNGRDRARGVCCRDLATEPNEILLAFGMILLQVVIGSFIN
jgi:hypothetical protein